MATVTIGERKLPARRPADLDARLVVSTGCTAAEHAAMLRPTSTPGQIARVLAPMLTGKDAPAALELAELIEAGDPLDVRAQVLDLLAAPADTEEG